MNRDLSNMATLLGDPGRAAILLSLMGGIALPAGELATIANVAPQTASEHLAKLVQGRLLSVERQGRRRYYRILSEQVADAIEAMLVLTQIPQAGERIQKTTEAVPRGLAYARTCYSHLAGSLGVRIADALQERAHLTLAEAKGYVLTSSGYAWFGGLGINISLSDGAHRKFARRCFDWTERRHHLAGTLGCEMYRRFKELKWVVPAGEPRTVRVTLEGRQKFWELLRIPLA